MLNLYRWPHKNLFLPPCLLYRHMNRNRLNQMNYLNVEIFPALLAVQLFWLVVVAWGCVTFPLYLLIKYNIQNNYKQFDMIHQHSSATTHFTLSAKIIILQQ